MLNHFRTYLLNRPHTFFAASAVPIYTDPKFVPVPFSGIMERIDGVLFGGEKEATAYDWRFIEFLRLIKACDLYSHVLRFDTRETYQLDDFRFIDTFALVRPERALSQVLEDAMSLGSSGYFDLFVPLRGKYPEYEEGFRRVTDTLHKFCMILFAHAIRLEIHDDV